MNNGGDAAEQVVRLSLEGFEVAAKLTGSAAKNVALLLVSVLKQEQQTKGKARLTNMIKSGKELKVFSIPNKDLAQFTKQAKRYGVLYCVLRDKSAKGDDVPVDIIARAEDASKIQRIVERFEIGKVDKAGVITQAEQDKADREAVAREVPTKTKGEIIVEEAMGKPLQKEGQSHENPTVAKMEKSPPSERSSEISGTVTDRGTAKQADKKPSVREKLERYKVAAKADKEADRAESALSKEKSKTPEPNRQTVHTQPKKHKKPKERYYRSYHTGSAKTLKSIQITLAARLEKFNLESLAALTCTDELDLASMGEKKVALFAIIPDNDSSFNFLVSILYTQLFQQLFFSADHIHGGALPIPVHFLMDEFANVSLPDDFDKILSVMRSRGVFVSIILQNLAQLKALFEKQWESIVGNCDEFLYLGGNEQSTHKYVSELLGKETIDTNTYGKSSGRSGNYSTNYQISGRELLTPDEVRMLDNRYAILFIRGELPVMDLKYDILKHPAVDLTADGKGGVYQHGKVTSNVATIEVQYLDPDTLPDTEVSETTYELLSDEDFNSETNNNTTTKLRR